MKEINKFEDEIILTGGKKYKKFPRTPKPIIVEEGVFKGSIFKKMRKKREI